MTERFDTASLFDRQGHRKYLNADERRRFLDASSLFGPDITALCQLLHFTGCRISEALALRIAHLDAKEGLVVLPTLKQRMEGRFRTVPLPEMLIGNLLEVGSRSSGEEIFQWHRSTAWEKTVAVMTRAEIDGVCACPRGVRHGFGVAAVAAGVPITLVQRWLGHARLETTSIYLEITGAEERMYAVKLWRN